MSNEFPGALPTVTEADVIDLLRERHAGKWKGQPEWWFGDHVRVVHGYDVHRVFDGVAVNLWPERTMTIDIYEVKVSRYDWLRELKDPDKTQAALDLADRFTIVAPVGVVQWDELPRGWGLIEVVGGELKDRVKPSWLQHTPAPFTQAVNERESIRGFVVGMLKASMS